MQTLCEFFHTATRKYPYPYQERFASKPNASGILRIPTGAGKMAFHGNSLPDCLVGVLRRRLMDAERLNCDSLPLWSAVSVSPADAAAFLVRENIDDESIEQLLFGLTLVNLHDQGVGQAREELRRSWRPAEASVSSANGGASGACDSGPTRGGARGRRMRPCAAQVKQRGVSPRDAKFPDGDGGMRLAASLVIPIHPIENLSRLVLREDREAATQKTGR